VPASRSDGRSGRAHWTWRDGEVEPGSAVLFDLDGVLANGDHRQRLLLTARPTTIQDLTLDWLARHSIRWDLLVMRRDGDFSASPDAKRGAVNELRAHGFEILLAFDDDRRNVDMFHAEGIRCLYIHSGYYEL
jgi:FMN phosphatase YigB (HAD superfamily)